METPTETYERCPECGSSDLKHFESCATCGADQAHDYHCEESHRIYSAFACRSCGCHSDAPTAIASAAGGAA